MRGRRTKAGTAPEIEFDPTFGDPWLVAAREAWQRGDWQTIERLAHEAPSPDLRDEIHRQLPEPSGDTVESWMHDWVAQRPASAPARATRGWRLTTLAWKARGSGYATTVTAAGAERFHALLREADDEFTAAIRLDPTDPLPWEQSLPSAKGLLVATEEARDRYLQVERYRPFSPTAAGNLVQILAPKWSGSAEEVLAFARDLSARAPHGHPVHAVVAEAHAEVMLSDETWVGNQWALGEVVAALDRSGLARGDQPVDAHRIRAMNTFAHCLWWFGDDPRAARLLTLLGWNPQRLTEMPWAYHGESNEVIWRVGREVGLW